MAAIIPGFELARRCGVSEARARSLAELMSPTEHWDLGEGRLLVRKDDESRWLRTALSMRAFVGGDASLAWELVRENLRRSAGQPSLQELSLGVRLFGDVALRDLTAEVRSEPGLELPIAMLLCEHHWRNGDVDAARQWLDAAGRLTPIVSNLRSRPSMANLEEWFVLAMWACGREHDALKMAMGVDRRWTAWHLGDPAGRDRMLATLVCLPVGEDCVALACAELTHRALRVPKGARRLEYLLETCSTVSGYRASPFWRMAGFQAARAAPILGGAFRDASRRLLLVDGGSALDRALDARRALVVAGFLGETSDWRRLLERLRGAPSVVQIEGLASVGHWKEAVRVARRIKPPDRRRRALGVLLRIALGSGEGTLALADALRGVSVVDGEAVFEETAYGVVARVWPGVGPGFGGWWPWRGG